MDLERRAGRFPARNSVGIEKSCAECEKKIDMRQTVII